MKEWKQSIILSLGGSLVVPNGGVDIPFLAKFNEFIRRHVTEGRRFFIIVGGGGTARQYQFAAKEVRQDITVEDLDWLGIHATRANAHLVRTTFEDIARPRVFDSYDEKEDLGDYPVLIGAGWKPGWSTDYCAVSLCKLYDTKLVINMTNTARVFNKDPQKYADATPIDTMSWQEYRSMIGDKWSPGFSSPFDPVAAKLADELNIKAIILDGRDLTNLDNAMFEKDFVGTTIR